MDEPHAGKLARVVLTGGGRTLSVFINDYNSFYRIRTTSGSNELSGGHSNYKLS